MSKLHQTVAPWEWHVVPGQAVRIAAGGGARWLLVTAGRVWLTQTGAGAAGPDLWLEAGARHRLPAGTDWVVEGWPQARVELLEAPQPRVSAVARRWRVWPPVLHVA